MQSEETNQPEELLSAAFDGEFASTVDVSPERRAKLEQGWKTIRCGIQAVPLAPVDLVSAVRAEIARSDQPTVVPSRLSDASRRNSLMVAIPGLSVIAAILLFAVLPRLQESDLAPEIGNWILPAVAASDWEVVVVNVPDDSKLEDSVRAVLGAAEQHGAGIKQLPTQNDVAAEYSAGILLADGGDTEAIVNSLEQSHQELDWNPGEIDGRSREEIKQLFLSSMEIPSRSEKAFGTMYIVREDSLSVTAMPLETEVASADIAEGELAEVADIEAVEQPSIPGRSVVAPAPADNAKSVAKPRVPLVVIFRRTAQPAKPAAVPDQGSLSVKPRIKPTV